MSAPTIVSVKGRRTRVRIEGDPTHRPVVLLHGIGRSLEDWGPQYTRLARTHRVIALDLPGFGFSARSPERTTLEMLAQGVLETLDTLGERRPLHVVGNSLGGAVAQQLLVLEPDRVASPILVTSAGFGSEVALPLRLIALPVIGDLLTRRTTRAGARLSERLAFADPRLANSVRIDHTLAIARQPDSRAVMRELTRELATGRGIKDGWRVELAAAVAKHPRPTLIVWGDRDRILPAHHLQAARRLLPHADTHLFTGIGHAPQIESPDQFSALVLTFLGDTERTEQPDPASASVASMRRRKSSRHATARRDPDATLAGEAPLPIKRVDRLSTIAEPFARQGSEG